MALRGVAVRVGVPLGAARAWRWAGASRRLVRRSGAHSMPALSISLDLSEVYWALPVPIRMVVGKCTRVSKEGAARPQ
jgi:hypothetical protein